MAVVIAVLLFPAAPMPLLREPAKAVFSTLHAALEHLDELVADRSTVDRTWTLAVGERIYEQLGQLIAARFTATEVVRLAPRWWHLRSTVRAADERLAHLNLLASGVMSLLRTTVDGLGVEPALPAQLRVAIRQLAGALGALAETRRSRHVRGGGPGGPRRPARRGGPARARHPRTADRFDHRRLRGRPVPRRRRRAGVAGTGCGGQGWRGRTVRTRTTWSRNSAM